MTDKECSICKAKADYKERDDDRYRYYCKEGIEELAYTNLEKVEDD